MENSNGILMEKSNGIWIEKSNGVVHIYFFAQKETNFVLTPKKQTEIFFFKSHLERSRAQSTLNFKKTTIYFYSFPTQLERTSSEGVDMKGLKIFFCTSNLGVE